MTSLALNVISPSWLNNKWIVRKTASAWMRLQSCHAIMEALLPLQYNHQVVVVVVVVVLFKCLLNLAIFFYYYYLQIDSIGSSYFETIQLILQPSSWRAFVKKEVM